MKPTNKPGWNPADASKIEAPSSEKKASGWSVGEKPSSKHFNWLFKNISEWIDHVDSQVEVDGAAINTRLSALESKAGVQAVSPITIQFPYNGGAAPGEYSAGGVLPGSTKAINWANGASQYLLLDADCTISMTGAVAGNVYYLRIQQGGYGNANAFLPSNISWSGGSVPVISSSPWMTDVIGLYFNGNGYAGFISKGHYNPPAGLETKNGYVAGGYDYPNQVLSVEKISFSSDTTVTTIQTSFGTRQDSNGSTITPRANASFNGSLFSGYTGQGTQSSTSGYRTAAVYINSVATHKIQFANDTAQPVSFVGDGTWNMYNPNNGYYPRRGVIQSSTSAHMWYQGSNASKLLFSNDTTSSRSVSTPNSGTSEPGSIGISRTDSGTIWQMLNSTSGWKMSFSNEASFSIVQFQTPFGTATNGTAGHWSEPVDGEFNGYFQIQTSNTPTTTIHKVNKSTDAWSANVASFSIGGNAGSATQGSTAGYISGGSTQNIFNQLPGINSIKKIAFSPETFAVHSATLSSKRQLAAGFEG